MEAAKRVKRFRNRLNLWGSESLAWLLHHTETAANAVRLMTRCIFLCNDQLTLDQHAFDGFRDVVLVGD